MTDMNEYKLFTRNQAAEIFQVDPRTIDRWIRTGKIRRVSSPGRIVRIPASEIDRLMNPLPFDELPEPEEV